MKQYKKETIINRLKGMKATLIALSEARAGIEDIEFSMDLLVHN